MFCSVEQKDNLGDIFTQVKDVDEKIMRVIIEMIRKEKNQDIIGYLSDNENQRNLKNNLIQIDKEQKFSAFRNNIKQITNVIKKIKNNDFNKSDYSTEGNQELIERIRDERQIIEFLKFLVHLTSTDNTLIQCGSNSLNLLVQMKVDLTNQSFENIKIKNTSLIGSNFVRCNLSGSEFEIVDVSGMNLNGAQLFNCKWSKLRIHELYNLDGHSSSVYSVCFSPHGTTLASGSYDQTIRLWDVKTGQQKSKLDGHSNPVQSICFSPDGTTLAFGGRDHSIRLWTVKTGQKIELDKDIHANIKQPFSSNSFQEYDSKNITILLISQLPIFQAKDALIFQGEFVNQQGIDLRTLFKQKGSYILESLVELQQK